MQTEKKLERFYRTGASKKITLQVYADTKAEFDEMLDRLNEITDIDIIEQKAGKTMGRRLLSGMLYYRIRSERLR